MSYKIAICCKHRSDMQEGSFQKHGDAPVFGNAETGTDFIIFGTTVAVLVLNISAMRREGLINEIFYRRQGYLRLLPPL